MLLSVLLFVLGILLIVKGGDIFVDAATWMAEKSGIPKFIIGATVVSIATTMPEILVSFLAAGEGKVDMAIGNAVGSVTANTGFILSIALMFMPIIIERRDYYFKSAMMLGAGAVILIFAQGGSLGLLPGLLLIGIFIAFMVDNIILAKKGRECNQGSMVVKTAPQPDKQPANIAYMQADGQSAGTLQAEVGAIKTAAIPAKTGNETLVNLLKFAVGTVGLVVGSQLLVDNGSAIAAQLGVPERIISVTIIAIGTSLPELVTAVTAIAKKQGALCIGNILGANIIDLALILPISSLIAGKSLPIAAQFASVDIPACLLVGCIALLPALVRGKFSRLQGAIMLAVYVGYLAITVL